MFPLICVWINDWVNNREAGDLRRYRAHYDVMVMKGSPRWRPFMWAFFRLLTLCEGNPLVSEAFHTQRSSNTVFDVYFEVSLMSRWTNSQFVGYLSTGWLCYSSNTSSILYRFSHNPIWQWFLYLLNHWRFYIFSLIKSLYNLIEVFLFQKSRFTISSEFKCGIFFHKATQNFPITLSDIVRY